MNIKNNNRTSYFILMISLFLFFYKSVFISLAVSEDLKEGVSTVFNFILVMIFSFSIFTFKIKEVFFIFFIFFCFLVNFVFFNNAYLFGYIILIFILTLSSRIEWGRIINLLMFVHIVVVILSLPVLFFVNHFSIHDDRIGERLTFGFDNPNTFSQYLISFYVVTVLFIFENIRNAMLRLLSISIITLSLFIFIYFTGSRTGVLLSFFVGTLFIFSVFNKKYSYAGHWFFKIYLISAMVFCIAQFYMGFSYIENEWAKSINTIMSGRLWLTKNLITTIWPFSIFHGVNIAGFMPIDFFYVSYFYTLGLFIGCLFIFIFFYKMKSQLLTLPMCIALWLALITTFTENYYTIPLYNIGLFIIFSKRKLEVHNENCSYDPSPQK